MRTGWRLALGVVVATVLVAGCSGDDDGDSGASGACPEAPVSVVASIAPWALVVQALGGDCVEVTTIVSSDSGDPHDFEPSPGDIAAFDDADLVVLNGARYDQWAVKAVDALSDKPTVVNVADVAGVADDDDPHLWYDPETVGLAAGAIEDALADLLPDSHDYLAERQRNWDDQLASVIDLVDEIRVDQAGTSIATTEPVFDRMAAALALDVATPPGFALAVADERDPSPADVAALLELIDSQDVAVLVYNSQTSGALPELVKAHARDAGVPVVEVTEMPPPGTSGYAQWQTAQLRLLQRALGSVDG